MAKHAKPSMTDTLSKNGARGAAALTMASFGFLATAPAAFAGGGDGDHGHDHGKKHGDVSHHESNDIDSHESQGVVNVADNDVLVPIQACNNYVPINVLGVQVPIEELNLAVPILTEGDTEADGGESCQQAAGIAEGGEKDGFASAGHAPATAGGGVPVDTDAVDEAVGGNGLGDVQGLVGEEGANPADGLTGEGASPSAGDALGLLPQASGAEDVVNPAGDLGLQGAPGAAQAEGLL